MYRERLLINECSSAGAFFKDWLLAKPLLLWLPETKLSVFTVWVLIRSHLNHNGNIRVTAHRPQLSGLVKRAIGIDIPGQTGVLHHWNGVVKQILHTEASWPTVGERHHFDWLLAWRNQRASRENECREERTRELRRGTWHRSVRLARSHTILP